MRTRVLRLVTVLGTAGVLCALTASCGLSKARDDAEKVLARHFQMISTNGYGAAMTDYGGQFFARTGRDQWEETLRGITSKLGPFRGYMITQWGVSRRAGGVGAGLYVRLVCQDPYGESVAAEDFTLLKGPGESEFKIIAHHINSPGLAP